MTANDDERRRHPRQPFDASGSLETHGAYDLSRAECSVLNVSRSGIGVETEQPPSCGQEVLLRIEFDGEVHECKTRATRIERAEGSSLYHVGLDWSECTPVQIELLDRVFAVIEAQQA